MIFIFDLDETLYVEKNFVLSGFKVVAKYLNLKYNFNYQRTFKDLKTIMKIHGRGKIFDKLLKKKKIYSKKIIKKLIFIYQHHRPEIKIKREALRVLKKLSKKNKLYLLTDGFFKTQQSKVAALRIKKYFKKIYYTGYYGQGFEKPSLKCFKMIKDKEKCDWLKLIYIADNPIKDFINLNKKQVVTVRVLQGIYKNTKVKKVFDGLYKINSLNEFLYLAKKKNWNYNAKTYK